MDLFTRVLQIFTDQLLCRKFIHTNELFDKIEGVNFFNRPWMSFIRVLLARFVYECAATLPVFRRKTFRLLYSIFDKWLWGAALGDSESPSVYRLECAHIWLEVQGTTLLIVLDFVGSFNDTGDKVLSFWVGVFEFSVVSAVFTGAITLKALVGRSRSLRLWETWDFVSHRCMRSWHCCNLTLY